MVKYHINPRTGNPGVCKAKYKCRFGDMKLDHYPTKKLAREAYEKRMKITALNKIYTTPQKLKDNSNKEIPKTSPQPITSLNSINDFIKNYGVNQNIRLTPEAEDALKVSKYEKSAQKLLDNFLLPMGGPYGGYFTPPTPVTFYKDSHNNFNYLETPTYGDFKFVGCGMEANVYLNEAEGMVYKVPNSSDYSRAGIWDDDKGAIALKTSLKQQEKYKELDHDSLAKMDIEYVETYFLKIKDKNGIPVPVVAQKYLSPVEYENYTISNEHKELLKNYKNITDIHSENVYINKKTGRIVLIDCLSTWDNQWDNSSKE